jgi:hypothetical protein
LGAFRTFKIAILPDAAMICAFAIKPHLREITEINPHLLEIALTPDW